jgi:hypothetical protein
VNTMSMRRKSLAQFDKTPKTFNIKYFYISDTI